MKKKPLKTYLGIELGSTRIKAVLIGEDHTPLASGTHEWENRYENGVWTYQLIDVWTGIQDSLRKLSGEVCERYNMLLTDVEAIGISAMMHGYLVFDSNNNQLVQFRTWRNTSTGEASKKLTELFKYNIPQRWSIAHLYQAMLNGESHVKDIAFMTTLAGYVHWKLTGRKVLGIGEASGVFPVDSLAYNAQMLQKFDFLSQEETSWKLTDILPDILNAGEFAGELTDEGAKLLDPAGTLKPGIPLCPPEGDAGTGMVATNSIAPRTGNVSAGTSIFAMVVLERGLSRVYPEIDMVTTPTGKPTAMVHCNNCTPELDAWVKLFGELLEVSGKKMSKPELYDMLYFKALEGEPDGGGLLAYNYHSGEHMTGFEEGRPLIVRTPDSKLTLANFMRTLIFSAMGTLKLGMDILTEQEHVRIERMLGHGGLFKTKGVGQKLMAAALNVPVAVMESAGEGGAWGISLLAAYMMQRKKGETLESYLSDKVFAQNAGEVIQPDEKGVQGFKVFMKRYADGLAIERAAVKNLGR